MGGITLSSSPYTPSLMSFLKFGISSTNWSNMSYGGAQSSPIIKILPAIYEITPVRVRACPDRKKIVVGVSTCQSGWLSRTGPDHIAIKKPLSLRGAKRQSSLISAELYSVSITLKSNIPLQKKGEKIRFISENARRKFKYPSWNTSHNPLAVQ